jgi:hypothetical protein
MLVKDEATAWPQESSDLRNRFGKFGNVVEGPAGHDGVERLVSAELLEGHGFKQLAIGRLRVDGDDDVA